MASLLSQRAASFALVGGRRSAPAFLKRAAVLEGSDMVLAAGRGSGGATAPHRDVDLFGEGTGAVYARSQPLHIMTDDLTIAAAREKLEHDMKRNFTLNVGRAIETLRDEVPNMLSQPMDLSIFSEDVMLTDRPGHAIATGKNQYAAFFATLRMARRLTLSSPTVEIKALRYLDWRSEISVKFTITASAPLGMEPITFDAISVYKLNDQGLIYEHRIDDVTRMNLFDRPSLFENLPLGNLVWNGPQKAPVPMPF